MVHARHKPVQDLCPPLDPVEVLVEDGGCFAKMISFVRFDDLRIVSAFRRHGGQAVISLDTVHIIAFHHFQNQRKDKILHFGIQGIHPLKFIFCGDAAFYIQ